VNLESADGRRIVRTLITLWLVALATLGSFWATSYRATAVWIPYDVQRRLEPVTAAQVRCTSYEGAVHGILVTPQTPSEAASFVWPYADWRCLGARYQYFKLETHSLLGWGIVTPWSSRADREFLRPRRPRGSGLSENPRTVRVVTVPYAWIFLAMVAGPLSVMGVRRAKRRRAGRRGLCAACGYDLRATPGRCPECGTLQEIKRAT
jgi:hypothetical protein